MSENVWWIIIVIVSYIIGYLFGISERKQNDKLSNKKEVKK